MTRSLALLAVGVAAAASFAVPASADPPCFSQDVRDCLRPAYPVIAVVCDAIGTCHIGEMTA